MSMSQLYCPLRKTYVIDLPEERVRVELIGRLSQELGYPLEMMAVEKELSQMPHLAKGLVGMLPQRRADLVCFVGNLSAELPLYPLLLVECKAVKLTPKMFQQLIGYNHYLRACFICLANADEIHTGSVDSATGQYRFIRRLPSRNELLAAVRPKGAG